MKPETNQHDLGFSSSNLFNFAKQRIKKLASSNPLYETFGRCFSIKHGCLGFSSFFRWQRPGLQAWKCVGKNSDEQMRSYHVQQVNKNLWKFHGFFAKKKNVWGKFGQKVPLLVMRFPLDDAFVVCVFPKTQKREVNMFVYKKHHSPVHSCYFYGFYPSSHNHGSEKWFPPIVVSSPFGVIFHFHDYGRIG